MEVPLGNVHVQPHHIADLDRRSLWLSAVV